MRAMAAQRRKPPGIKDMTLTPVIHVHIRQLRRDIPRGWATGSLHQANVPYTIRAQRCKAPYDASAGASTLLSQAPRGGPSKMTTTKGCQITVRPSARGFDEMRQVVSDDTAALLT
jgi:hypothetical protein